MRTPSSTVSDKEIVGRRAFGNKVFDNRATRTLPYQINIFLETRDNMGLSVDRLGVRKAYSDVLSFRTPHCDSLAKIRAKEFVGWAQLCVSDIQQIGISSTEAINEENPYHAEISLSDHDSRQARRSLAFRLCVFASKHKFIHRSDNY